MQFSISVVLGLAIGLGLLAASRKPAAEEAEPASWPAWTAFGLGVAAVAVLAVGIAGAIDVPFAAIPAIALPIGGAAFGVGRVVMGDRRWQVWAGLALAGLPALFWLVFAIGEIFGPAH